MPQVKGMRLGRLKSQPALPPTRVVMARRRRPNGFGPNQPIVTSHDEAHQIPPPNRFEWDLAIFREYKRELAACLEQACPCTCHCHQGSYCTTDELTPFHFRQPNLAHKRSHKS